MRRATTQATALNNQARAAVTPPNADAPICRLVTVILKLKLPTFHCTISVPGAYPKVQRDLYPRKKKKKLPKLDLTIDGEYVANLVNVNMWL